MRVKFTACEPTRGQYRDFVAVGWHGSACFGIGGIDDPIHQTRDGIHSGPTFEVGQEIVFYFSYLLLQVFSRHNLRETGLFLADSMRKGKLNVNRFLRYKPIRSAGVHAEGAPR